MDSLDLITEVPVMERNDHRCFRHDDDDDDVYGYDDDYKYC